MIRGRFADLVDVDRSATSGDNVTIDIIGEVDGEALPGLTAEDYSYEVGSGGVGEMQRLGRVMGWSILR